MLSYLWQLLICNDVFLFIHFFCRQLKQMKSLKWRICLHQKKAQPCEKTVLTFRLNHSEYTAQWILRILCGCRNFSVKFPLSISQLKQSSSYYWQQWHNELFQYNPLPSTGVWNARFLHPCFYMFYEVAKKNTWLQLVNKSTCLLLLLMLLLLLLSSSPLS